jgi:hypothetical protein
VSKIGTLILTGASGTDYKFNVYPYGTEFKEMGAVYYISKRTEKPDGSGSHSKIYIGQTGDLSERFDDHHKEPCFKKNNANCHSIHSETDERKRLNIEKDLIDALNPPCNG